MCNIEYTLLLGGKKLWLFLAQTCKNNLCAELSFLYLIFLDALSEQNGTM